MIKQIEMLLPPMKRGYHLVTRELESRLPSGINNGFVHLFLQHTSAALTLNENVDPDVRTDFESFMDRLVPDGDGIFIHTAEGKDDMSAHIKSSLLGSSVTVPLVNGRFRLGTWQGIYLCEFRNHASARSVYVTIIGE